MHFENHFSLLDFSLECKKIFDLLEDIAHIYTENIYEEVIHRLNTNYHESIEKSKQQYKLTGFVSYVLTDIERFVMCEIDNALIENGVSSGFSVLIHDGGLVA
jgi:hypothetical protein